MENFKKIASPNHLETDFKSEVFASMLIDNGIDIESIVFTRAGNSRSNISKDIEEVIEKYIMTGIEEKYVEIKTNRRGIYDSLPEGLFHASVFPNKIKGKEEIIEEIKQHRNEEFFIRRFFSLFENEIDRKLAHVSHYELIFDKKNTYRNYVNIFLSYFPIIKLMPTRNALLFLKILPHIYTIRTNFQEVGEAIGLIVDAPVEIVTYKKKQALPSTKKNRLNRMNLGYDSALVGEYDDGKPAICIHIGKISAREAYKFIADNDFYKIVYALADIFFEADIEISIKISVIEEECQFYLQSKDNLYPCYLGINTYI